METRVILTISFDYKNHRGEVTERTVDVEALEYLPAPGFGYVKGWFLSGHCHTKNARRSFALQNIVIKDPQSRYKLLSF